MKIITPRPLVRSVLTAVAVLGLIAIPGCPFRTPAQELSRPAAPAVTAPSHLLP